MQRAENLENVTEYNKIRDKNLKWAGIGSKASYAIMILYIILALVFGYAYHSTDVYIAFAGIALSAVILGLSLSASKSFFELSEARFNLIQKRQAETDVKISELLNEIEKANKTLLRLEEQRR